MQIERPQSTLAFRAKSPVLRLSDTAVHDILRRRNKQAGRKEEPKTVTELNGG